jgi:uracil-DNA glycosylase family 4
LKAKSTLESIPFQLEHDNRSDLWNDLQNEIISCRKCPRLVDFREKVAKEKKKQFINFDYWGKPVPSFGTPDARLVIIGLAPAAHGGNRTGRMFTGDGSSRFLFKHLYLTGFASQPVSENREDGQYLIDSYITASLHCVPPDNKPTSDEIRTCAGFLEREFPLLSNCRAILALGSVAFDSVIDFARSYYAAKGRLAFSHGKRYFVAEGFPELYASYHPSPRNTQTGKLTSSMFLSLLKKIRRNLDKIEN